MKRRTKVFGCTLLLSMLTACATNWHNPRYAATPAIHDRQLAMDNGYCKMVSSGSAPMPSMYIAPAAPQAYQVTGQSTTYTPYGVANSNYTGTVRPYTNPGQSFATGAMQGAAMGAVLRARMDQEEIHKGCMLTLGWMDRG